MTRSPYLGAAALAALLALAAGAPVAGQKSRPRAAAQPRLLAMLKDNAVAESSGLTVSRRDPKVLWTHNDSGGDPVLYATDRAGRALARFTVVGATAVDWEGIAAGPGPAGEPALFIGDIGDNGHARSSVVVYRVDEPPVDRAHTDHRGHTHLAQRFAFRYPDGPRDAETLLVHPASGEVFVISKEESGVSGAYRLPMPLARDRTVTAERVATIRFTNPLEFGGHAVGRLATGGDFSRDGRHVAIRTYAEAFEWSLRPGQALGEALRARPRTRGVPFLGQFEALTYDSDNRSLLTTAEGSPCPLWWAP
ncbi:MAG: hypothetical protein IT208_10495 [Chthonomonadales bacterium]|nr:hypothetical protein [Chthonomonadales bacterium]